MLPYFQWTFNVLNDVLKGLCALHSAYIVHGAVHPDNVFIDANGHAILAESMVNTFLVHFTDISLSDYQSNVCFFDLCHRSIYINSIHLLAMFKSVLCER